jgi:hypothetical protein
MAERFIHQIDRRNGKDEFLFGLSIDPADRASRGVEIKCKILHIRKFTHLQNL